MLYDIGLRIVYDYESPAIGGRHVLMLTPAQLGADQRVIASQLQIDPPTDEYTHRRDFFGNDVVEIAFRKAHAHIAFSMQCRVDRAPTGAPLDVSPTLSTLAHEISALHDLGPNSPHHFLSNSPRVRVTAPMTTFAAANTTPVMSVFQIVTTVASALHKAMRFDAKATTVDTAPEEAFERRHGVCQDFSHILIACLRGLGIPAGYVSGFLRTIPPPGKARLEGADAMHAWVRAWCGAELGWVDIDPTNDLLVGPDHIVIAYGRDYSDVAPIKGVLRTAGAQTTHQAVDVRPVASR